jgi:hypothetical protein
LIDGANAAARCIQGAARRHAGRSKGRDAAAVLVAERFTTAAESFAAALEAERHEAARRIQAGARVWSGRRTLSGMRAERQRLWASRAAEEDPHNSLDVDF